MGASRRVEAYIDGIALTQAVPGAIIRQITEDVPQTEQTAFSLPGTDGQRILGVSRRSRKISVEFVLREIHDLTLRAQMQEQAAAWAHDGVLTVSYRPDRRIRVRCTAPPVIGAARDYTQVLKAEFTAPLPWWEDAAETVFTMTGTSGAQNMRITGSTLYVPVTARITPAEATLTTLSITCRGTSMSFSDLNVAAGTPLVIGYTDEGYLTIRAGAVDWMSARSPASSDELLIQPGFSNTITFSANTAVTLELSARGRYA